MSLQGKTAIVTGASRGIGRATAELLARRGARVLGCALDAERLEAAMRGIREAGGEAFAKSCDVADEEQVEALFAAADRRFGRLELLVNNAGILVNKPFWELEAEEWDRVLAVNLRGAFLCARAAFRRMLGRGGAIVNVASLGGLRGFEKLPGLCAYTASKSGLVGLTESLAAEGRPHGIRVNGICPGAVDTEMLRRSAAHLRAGARPEDIARMIAFLLDEQSAPLTGANLEVYSNA
jgi:NAD(P)-dependent dehydrogenase (short-subunit alcohol dehydrogenase family)